MSSPIHAQPPAIWPSLSEQERAQSCQILGHLLHKQLIHLHSQTETMSLTNAMPTASQNTTGEASDDRPSQDQ